MQQSTRQNPDILNLSEEIIVEIFVTLPVKTLVLLKCVCKQWCTLISSPWFISLHLKRFSSDPNDHYILVQNSVITGLIPLRNPSCLVKLIQPYKADYSVVGSINGLICLSRGMNELIYLWNPTIKKFKLLPMQNLKLYKAYKCYVSVGFGYEKSSDDYKITRIVNYEKRRQATAVDVYSTKLESWRKVTTDIDLNVTNCSCDAIVEGFTYWIIREHRKTVVASFDLRSETFSITPVPDVLVTESRSFSAMNYCGSFALLVHSPHYEFNMCLEVWAIEGGNSGQGLLQKKFTFGMGFDFSRHWGLPNGDIVVQNVPNVPFLFNLRTKERRIMGIWSVDSAFYYMESLVSVKGFQKAPYHPFSYL